METRVTAEHLTQFRFSVSRHENRTNVIASFIGSSLDYVIKIANNYFDSFNMCADGIV